MKATTWNFSFPESTASIQQDNWDWAQHKKQPQKTPHVQKKGTISFKKPSRALGMFPHLGGFHRFLFLFCVNQKAFAWSSANKKVLIIDDIQKPNIVHFTVKLNFLIKKKERKEMQRHILVSWSHVDIKP